jgi:hypothetical protein
LCCWTMVSASVISTNLLQVRRLPEWPSRCNGVANHHLPAILDRPVRSAC